MRHSCPTHCVCVKCRSAMASSLRRRRRKKRNARNRRERSSAVGKRNVTVLNHHHPRTTMSVTVIATIPLDRDALSALETATLALLSILVDSGTAASVLVLPTLLDAAVVAQTPVTSDENGAMALTRTVVVLSMNGGPAGPARTSPSRRRIASGAAGNVVAHPRGTYGMVTIVGSNALAPVPPRSRLLVIPSAHVPARHRGHQWPPPKIVQHAWLL